MFTHYGISKRRFIAMRNYIREQKRPNEFMRILNHIRLSVKESMKTYSNIDHVEKMIGKIKEETAQMKKCLVNDIFFTSGVNKIYENLRKLVRQMNNFVKSEHRREVI